jgi:hypothetical protein
MSEGFHNKVQKLQTYRYYHYYQERQVRTIWDKEKEEWYFSVVDVIAVLTDSPNPRNYWKVLKHRLLEDEGSEVVTNCNQLKMQAADGKFYKTDCMTTEQLFRLIQSVPSPKAEPFKLWMAQVARERLDEIKDPEISVARRGGTIAKEAREKLEAETGKKVISPSNALSNDRLIETKASVFD